LADQHADLNCTTKYILRIISGRAMIAQAGADRDCICLGVAAWAGVAVMDRVNHGGLCDVALTEDKRLTVPRPFRPAPFPRAAKFFKIFKMVQYAPKNV
jgi:hypothetical protein